MAQDLKHRALLQFIRKIIEVPVGYSKEDLMIFRSIASRDYPAFVPLMDDYLRMAENADTDVSSGRSAGKRAAASADKVAPMHLFDMLRDKKLFPTNSDLSEFAGRILPGMSRARFEKVSRADIAARIIEYLETKERHTRDELEASMRSAIAKPGSATPTNRKSFFSQWENIIKGIQS
jgi:hypothetical protein